jgi:hypothetical protein
MRAATSESTRETMDQYHGLGVMIKVESSRDIIYNIKGISFFCYLKWLLAKGGIGRPSEVT